MESNTKKLLCVIASAVMFTACGSSDSGGSYSNSKSASYAEGASYAADNSAEYYDEDYAEEPRLNDEHSSHNDSNDAADKQKQQAKLIYTGTVHLETLEYDNAVASIKNDMNAYGGFIENSSESSNVSGWYRDDYDGSPDRSLTAVVRIPSENFEAFMNGLANYGQKTYESTNVENVSRRYADNEAQIAALEKEESRLLEMMDSAYTIEDMITVEERLTTVQGQLNSYRTSLSALDSDIRYSTVTIEIKEVHKYTPVKPEKPTFSQRLSEHIQDTGTTFVEVMEGLLFLLIALFPYLVIIGIIVAIVISVRKKHKKKKAEALQAQMQNAQPQTANDPVAVNTAKPADNGETVAVTQPAESKPDDKEKRTPPTYGN